MIIQLRLRTERFPRVRVCVEEQPMNKPYYSKEQAEYLHGLRDAAGGARFDQAWAELIAAIRAEMDGGGSPRSERARILARRWRTLVETFTGGNAETERLLYETADRFYVDNSMRGTPVPDVLGYIREALTQENLGPR